MHTKNAWVRTLIMGTFAALLLASCEERTFQGNSGRRTLVKKADNYPLQISTRNLQRARPDVDGRGELVIQLKAESEITCVNCPAGMQLQFERRNNTDGTIEYFAPFAHRFARDTEFCPVELRFRHTTGRLETLKYGLYFCPVDLSLETPRCDKASARNICTL